MQPEESLRIIMDALIFQHFRDGSALAPYIQLIGEYGAIIYDKREMLVMYLHLIVSAIFPIYIGSHASLRCPPSAELKKVEPGEDEDDLGKEAEPIIEGLTPSDAILFPIAAGLTLGGLYFLIKWLNDPKILNRILNWYFSGIGIFGVGKLASDALNVGTTFIFPSVWSSKSATYHVDPLFSTQVTGSVKKTRVQQHRTFTDKTNPLPGFLSNLKFGPTISKSLWSLRSLLKSHWIFRTYIHSLVSFTTPLKIADITGLLIGISSIILYNTFDRSWYLSNLIAFGFCYGTLQLMSPTTFWTGTLVLSGLFIYDITMVFYTPMMVTVATSLDVPIKLIFPGPKRGSMLGLGDVVLPGIMMALALRFDLYLHYLRKQSTSTSVTPGTIKKAQYKEATGVWGERFWTQGRASEKEKEETVADGARFQKTYFKASVVGYIFGMIVTLIVMNRFNHAQPALLYLVPGVLGSLWGTALVRGEWKFMWEYAEDGTWGFDEKGEKKSEGEKKDEGSKETIESLREERLKKRDDESKKEHAHHVFLFSLSAPKKGMKKALLFDKTD